MSSPWSDIVHAVSEYYTTLWAAGTGGAVSNASGDVSQAAQAAGSGAKDPFGIGGLVTVIEGIWAGLTDGKMWRSFAWIILGVILMLLGTWWWVGKSAPAPIPIPV